MRKDREAVAGFFEDLPVLVFVLSGVMSLVLTSTFVAERIDADRNQERLDVLALRVVDSLAARILSDRGSNLLPTVAAVTLWNYSTVLGPLSEGHDYLFTLKSLHPSYACLVRACSDESDAPRSTGHGTRLLNALDERNTCVVLEACVIVW